MAFTRMAFTYCQAEAVNVLVWWLADVASPNGHAQNDVEAAQALGTLVEAANRIAPAGVDRRSLPSLFSRIKTRLEGASHAR